MADSVRSLVKAIEAELRDPDLPIGRVADHALSLSSLLSSLNAHIRGCELAYKRVLVELRKSTKSVADATLQAEITPEYGEWVEAKDLGDSTMELIRTLRKALDTLREEVRLQR